jgi:uncharacterized membrane protein
VFGIHGLDALGLVHTLLGALALLFGLAVVVQRKGTRTHQRIGRAYFASMLLLNGTSFMIYDLYGRFGPFHIAAVISMATTAAGFLPAYLRRPHTTWMAVHGIFMGWSYVGLLAAFVAEIATRIPGVRFGTGVIGATALAMVGGAILIHTRVPKIVSTFAKSPAHGYERPSLQ